MTVNEHNIHKTKQGRPNYLSEVCTGERLILVEITDVIKYTLLEAICHARF
jgi:hypothetical protein